MWYVPWDSVSFKDAGNVGWVCACLFPFSCTDVMVLSKMMLYCNTGCSAENDKSTWDIGSSMPLFPLSVGISSVRLGIASFTCPSIRVPHAT